MWLVVSITLILGWQCQCCLDDQTNNLHLSNNWKGSSELLVNHEAKDTHHGSTAIVQLNGALGELSLLIKGVPAEVNGSITEVTNEFISSSLNVLHDTKLKGANESNDLSKSSRGDGIRSEESGSTVGEGVEGVSGVVNVSWKVDSGTGDDVTKEGKLSNTSVLDLDVTKTVESFLGDISGKHTKRIEESKRR
eukprot:919680_1